MGQSETEAHEKGHGTRMIRRLRGYAYESLVAFTWGFLKGMIGAKGSPGNEAGMPDVSMLYEPIPFAGKVIDGGEHCYWNLPRNPVYSIREEVMTMLDGKGIVIDQGWTTLGNIYRVQLLRRNTQHNIQEQDLRIP